jgi:hypothetical protein
MSELSRIDAAEVDSVRPSPDGTRLILLLRDAAGQKVSLSLPRSCISAILTAAPQPTKAGVPHSVAVWHMSLGENGQDVIMTFCTPEGMAMSFAIKSWQAQAMATVAMYGVPRDSASKSVH